MSAQDFAEVGRLSLAALLRAIKTGVHDTERAVIAPQLIVARASHRPVRRSALPLTSPRTGRHPP